MVSTLTVPTINDGYYQTVPIGFDCGFGFSKFCYDNEVVVEPSYFLELKQATESSSVIEYFDGPRSDLRGKRWLVGESAYLESPLAYQRLVDERFGKIEYGLQMLLGCLQKLPQQSNWNIALSISVQDAEVFGEHLQKSFEGCHVVEMNGREVTVTIMPRVFEEGRGVIVSAIKSGVLRPNSQCILIDLGFGTTISQVFSGTQLIKQSRTVQPEGVRALVEAIARHPDTRLNLGQEGDRALIRLGIENASFDYGYSGWNFREIYHQHLPVWVRTILSPGLKPVAPWKPKCEVILASGGGSLLPNIAQMLVKHGIACLPDAATANASGLLIIAQHSVKGGGAS